MNILVLNMGMKSIRSIIFDSSGHKLAGASRTINTAINGRCVEQNPNEWWKKAKEVMKVSLRDARISFVDYITVTTSASCLVPVDINGESIRNSVMVSDKRAIAEAEEIRRNPVFQPVKEETGIDMSASLLLPKILWLKNNEPDKYSHTRYFLSSNDYLVCRLCGEVVTDYLNAAKFHYIIDKARYPKELLLEFGIPEEKLPKVVETGTTAGILYNTLSEELGIRPGTKVVITSYDAICSFVGSGVSKEGEASDVSGTVTVLRMLSKKNYLRHSDSIYITPFHQDRYNIVGGSNNLGGGLIEWVKQCYYAKEEYPYEVMEKDAGESEIGARGIIFLPYLLGERAPIWNDNARGVFFGLERMHTRKDMTRAVFEATAFIDRTMIEAIKETTADVDTIRVSGGLARVNLVSKIKADVLGRDVLVLSEFETTASGAAMMVLQKQEKIPFDELSEKFSSIRMVIKPNKENHNKYNIIYQLFKDTYTAMIPLFDRRCNVLEQIRTDRETQIENL